MTTEQKQQIQYLLAKYAEGKSSADEEQQLWQLYREEDLPEWEGIVEEFMSAEPELVDYNKERWEPIVARILGHDEHNGATTNTTKVRRMWKWVAAAAIIIIIASLTVVGLLTNNHPTTSPVGVRANDVAAPSNTRAVITLANGSKVYLDSASNGTIAQENNVNVVKNQKGEVVYNTVNTSKADGRTLPGMLSVTYNTLFNPRGSQVISLTLTDGTRVWLNSESSLRYPTAFNGSTREVEITGEAYFEVKHNSKQPFKVHLPNGGVVEDIGTAFNVNAYSDESDLKTTLIEGSVKLSSSRSGVLAVKLKPGEQASINQVNTKISPIEVQTNVDVDEVTAWKNGRFEFAGQDVDATMRQIARWYDVEIVYEGPKPQANFRGTISRQENVGEVLKMLELTKAVKFRVEGKRVIVSK